MRRTTVAVLTLAVASSFAFSRSSTPALNDPTIVAIFDAANTADIETGALAAEQGASK